MTETTQDLLNDNTSRPKPRYFISETDCIKLDTSRDDLPYMKYVELTNLTPQNFGLDNWEPNFRIPDYWMKKIYKNDVYRDTDLPDTDPEIISEAQKEILHNYFLKNNHYGFPYKSDKRNLRPSRHQVAPPDDLIELLEGGDNNKETERGESSESSHDDKYDEGEDEEYEEEEEDVDTSNDIQVIQIDSDSSEQVLSMTPYIKKRRKKRRKFASPSPSLPLSESRTTYNNITILRHKVQPEEAIVEMVLEKMKHLEPKEEKRYHELLKDKEFMKLLDSHAEKYAKMDPT